MSSIKKSFQCRPLLYVQLGIRSRSDISDALAASTLTSLGDFSALQIMLSGFDLTAQVTNTVWNELCGPSYIVTNAFFSSTKTFSVVFSWRCWRSLPLSAAFWAASSFTWDICDVSITTADRFYLLLAATWNRYGDADSVDERRERGRQTKREHLARDVPNEQLEVKKTRLFACSSPPNVPVCTKR